MLRASPNSLSSAILVAAGVEGVDPRPVEGAYAHRAKYATGADRESLVSTLRPRRADHRPVAGRVRPARRRGRRDQPGPRCHGPAPNPLPRPVEGHPPARLLRDRDRTHFRGEAAYRAAQTQHLRQVAAKRRSLMVKEPERDYVIQNRPTFIECRVCQPVRHAFTVAGARS